MLNACWPGVSGCVPFPFCSVQKYDLSAAQPSVWAQSTPTHSSTASSVTDSRGLGTRRCHGRSNSRVITESRLKTRKLSTDPWKTVPHFQGLNVSARPSLLNVVNVQFESVKNEGGRLATLKAPNFPPNMKSTGRRACRGKICFLKVPSFYGSLAFEGCLQTEKENFGSSTLCSSGKNVFKNVETSSPHTLVSTPSVLCHIVQNKLC